jgi:cyclopropane fatty-acyl-phospholipid synthase-like methyltransferase
MNTNEWYNSKLEQFGENDFRSLNWGDKEGKSAKARYQQMFEQYDWSNKKILEIGCGWGSFFDFGFTCSGYYGIDINSKIIDIANKKYPNETFKVEDISKLKPTTIAFDVAISSGVAGNRQGPADTPDKLMHYLNFMFNTANTVVVNFPSNRATIRSEGVEYFAPEYIVSQALILTNNIQLIHKNQSDFLLILKHNE